MRVHVAFTPAEAERAPTADRRRRPPRHLDDRPGARLGLPPSALLRRGRGGSRAAGSTGRGGAGRRAEGGCDPRLRPRQLAARVHGAARRDARPHDDERDEGDPRRGGERRDRARRQPAQPRRRARPRRAGEETWRSSAPACRAASRIDDAYCAGRIAELLGGERSDAAEAAVRIARSFADAAGGADARPRTPSTRCSGRTSPGAPSESVLEVVPRLARLEGAAAEIVAVEP